MKTFHVRNLPKGMEGRKLKLPIETYRIRLNSRAARALRRAKVDLIRP